MGTGLLLCQAQAPCPGMRRCEELWPSGGPSGALVVLQVTAAHGQDTLECWQGSGTGTGTL